MTTARPGSSSRPTCRSRRSGPRSAGSPRRPTRRTASTWRWTAIISATSPPTSSCPRTGEPVRSDRRRTARGWVNDVVEHPDGGNLLVAGTEVGAFLSFDRGGSWVRVGGGLPHVPVDDIEIHPRERISCSAPTAAPSTSWTTAPPSPGTIRRPPPPNSSSPARRPSSCPGSTRATRARRATRGRTRRPGALLTVFLPGGDGPAERTLEIRNASGDVVARPRGRGAVRLPADRLGPPGGRRAGGSAGRLRLTSAPGPDRDLRGPPDRRRGNPAGSARSPARPLGHGERAPRMTSAPPSWRRFTA